ncbi:MAG: glutathione-disulfide reductase [Dongiaceae bacterium]
MTIRYDYDLFVIGAGSGGVRAARMSADYGARVAIAEEYRVGGTCVIRGCVPKKLLSYGAHFHEDFEDAVNYGWTVEGMQFDWSRLIANKDREIDRLNGIYKELLKNSGVTTFETRAVLEDAHTVRLGDRRITAEYMLIAVGGHPVKPETPGAELGITSNEAFYLETLPKRVLIVGGGYVALEFASIFNGLGSEVILTYRRDQILRGFDDDVRRFTATEMAKKGVDIRVYEDPVRLERSRAGIHVSLTGGTVCDADIVMFATGRVPNTRELGLDAVGVELDVDGAVKVDPFSRTAVENIYSIGDCTNRANLTPVAIREGVAFADTMFGKRPWSVDHDNIPSAVFSHPPVGSVGPGEADARRRFGAVDIYKADFKPLKHTMTGRTERTLIKLVVDRASQRVLGAHMVGIDAPEIIQGIAIAVKLGLTKRQLDETVAIHPTAAEEFVTLRTPLPDPAEAAAE